MAILCTCCMGNIKLGSTLVPSTLIFRVMAESRKDNETCKLQKKYALVFSMSFSGSFPKSPKCGGYGALQKGVIYLL